MATAFRMVLAAVTILVLTVATHSAEKIPADLPGEPTDKQAEDLIAMQLKMAEVVGPALTDDELQALREALWKRETEELQHGAPRIGEPDLFMRIAFAHLLQGKPLRRGDVIALHGVLLSALQPNTYALAKHWQWLVLHSQPTS